MSTSHLHPAEKPNPSGMCRSSQVKLQTIFSIEFWYRVSFSSLKWALVIQYEQLTSNQNPILIEIRGIRLNGRDAHPRTVWLISLDKSSSWPIRINLDLVMDPLGHSSSFYFLTFWVPSQNSRLNQNQDNSTDKWLDNHLIPDTVLHTRNLYHLRCCLWSTVRQYRNELLESGPTP